MYISGWIHVYIHVYIDVGQKVKCTNENIRFVSLEQLEASTTSNEYLESTISNESDF